MESPWLGAVASAEVDGESRVTSTELSRVVALAEVDGESGVAAAAEVEW